MTAIKITIGRNDDNTLKVPEDFSKMSGYHGDITMDTNGNLVFTDYSSNGTIINGERILKTSKPINRGDEILLAGECVVKWEVLNNLLPTIEKSSSRETVILNQSQDGGRQTVMMEQSDGGRKTVYKDPNQVSHLVEIPSDNQIKTVLDRQIIERHSSDGKKRIDNSREVISATKKWNWGAFCLSFIWGCFHKIYWPLIVPAANLIVFLLPFMTDGDLEIFGMVITWIIHLAIFVVATYLGINGSEQAWKLKVYKDLDDFKAKEKRWATAGFIFTGVQVVSIAIATVLLIDKM